MKKVTILFVSFFVIISLSANTLYDKLYLVGDASDAGWNPGAAIELTKTGEGIFVWTGTLKDNANNRRFKFIVARDWHPSITCRFNIPGHLIAESGEEYDLFVRPNGDTGHDNAFQVTETETYSIKINLNTMKITVTKKSLTNLPEELWIIGDAVPDGKVKLFMDRSGIKSTFRYIGELFVGEIKFSTTEQETAETQYIVPDTENNDINGETNFRLVSDKNISGWSVNRASIAYKINADLLTEKLVSEIYQPPLRIYLIGDGTAAGWDLGNSLPFTVSEESPYVFTFTGDLKITKPDSHTRNAFKILPGQDNWYPAISPYQSDELITGSQYFMFSTGIDNRWIFDENKQGAYSFVVDLLQETISVTYEGNSTKTTDIKIADILTVFVSNQTIELQMKDNKIASSIVLFDITGKIVSSHNNVSSTILSNNLLPGIYIIKTICNEQKYINKIFVK